MEAKNDSNYVEKWCQGIVLPQPPQKIKTECAALLYSLSVTPPFFFDSIHLLPSCRPPSPGMKLTNVWWRSGSHVVHRLLQSPQQLQHLHCPPTCHQLQQNQNLHQNATDQIPPPSCVTTTNPTSLWRLLLQSRQCLQVPSSSFNASVLKRWQLKLSRTLKKTDLSLQPTHHSPKASVSTFYIHIRWTEGIH